MADNDKTTPQKAYYTNQDVVSPNIETLYNNIIKDIDTYRSKFNSLENVPDKLTTDSLDSIFSGSAVGLAYQESRCHTFFRMMGFPVSNADGSLMYSPGFDPDVNRDNNAFKKKLDIANSLLGNTNLKNILNERELHSKNSINPFQLASNDSIALAVSSIFPRPFDKQLKQGVGPLEKDPQTFVVEDRASVALIFKESVKYNMSSKHILKPFIVDPRIDLTVTPILNRICAPFLENKGKTQVSSSNYLRRPYIERVIRVRLSNKNVLATTGVSSSDQYINDLLAFIKENTKIDKPELVEITSNALHNLYGSEIVIFSRFIKIIEALIKNLVQSITDIDQIRSFINWKPLCSKDGPEFGAELNTVDGKDDFNNKQIELDIVDQQLQKYLSETEYNLGLSKPDLGGFAFSGIDDMIFGSVKNVPKFYDRQLGVLNNRRDGFGNKANGLMRNIEIITGEFSGLGLLDIMAVQAALWVIKPDALLGLIDDNAIERMKKDNDLQAGSKIGVKDALMEYEKKLSEIYLLMQAFFDDEKAGEKRNKQ